MATFASLVLKERPPRYPGYPIPAQTFRKQIHPIPTEADLADGQILFETYYVSIDPAMLGWMQDSPSYLPPVAIGETMRSWDVGKIVASKSSLFRPGDVVSTMYAGCCEFSIVNEADLFRCPPGIPMADLLGIFGVTGLTAYFGVDRIAKPKPGDLAVVSAAAGGTGTVAGQILKLKGCTVVGIAGGQDKVEWLTGKMGFDVALDYKAADFKQKFDKAVGDGVDIYFDNVRGDVLDLCLGKANTHSRFVMCGNMSQRGRPGGEQAYKNFGKIAGKRLIMQGLLTMDYIEDFPTAFEELASWYAEKKIWTDDTIIKGGVEAIEDAIVHVCIGGNKGKTLVEIKSQDA